MNCKINYIFKRMRPRITLVGRVIDGKHHFFLNRRQKVKPPGILTGAYFPSAYSLQLRTIRNAVCWLAAICLPILFAGIVFGADTTESANLVAVNAKLKPENPWKSYPTRTLASLPEFQPGKPGPDLDKFGGRTDRTWEKSGYFYAKKSAGRWWLVDPEGHPFIHVAVNGVSVGRSPALKKAFNEQFGTSEKWAEATSQLLADNCFNGTGAWSDTSALRATTHPPVYVLIWNFMSNFGKSLGITSQQAGHAGYPNGCIPVFHPQFESYCAQLAKQLELTKNDPYLLGHFSDNELPCPQLEKYLNLDPNDAVMGTTAKAAREWLAQRKENSGADAKNITTADREAFAGFIFNRYLAITTGAIRKADPNHLCLGSRFHSNEKAMAPVFEAAGKYLDVVGINLYHLWTPDMKMLNNWEEWSGKPCLITEFYTKGADKNFPNNGGVGWIVPTQNDRGLFYQNYTLQLLESGVCVGWHWFKYQDNDPADLTTDLSNRDSNKGIVALDFTSYTPLLNRMKPLNLEVYRLADYFDRSK